MDPRNQELAAEDLLKTSASVIWGVPSDDVVVQVGVSSVTMYPRYIQILQWVWEGDPKVYQGEKLAMLNAAISRFRGEITRRMKIITDAHHDYYVSLRG